jgi:hypothetical protein
MRFFTRVKGLLEIFGLGLLRLSKILYILELSKCSCLGAIRCTSPIRGFYFTMFRRFMNRITTLIHVLGLVGSGFT